MTRQSDCLVAIYLKICPIRENICLFFYLFNMDILKTSYPSSQAYGLHVLLLG